MAASPTRRQVLTALAALPFLLGTGRARAEARRLPWVIRGGRVFFQEKLQTIDVGIDAEGRVVLGNLEGNLQGNLEGEQVFDAAGKVVSPGFIDILADSGGAQRRVFEQFKLADGVTTALELHGGTGDARRYYAASRYQRHLVNHGVSTKIMTIRGQYGTVAGRVKQVQRCLDQGALAVSHSIEYQPAGYDELLEYGRLAAKYDRPFFLHLRHSSKEQELEGVQEAVRLASETGARIHLDHLHSTGGTWAMEKALELIRNARAAGHQMTCCVYPYSNWATYIGSRRFDSGWRERYGLSWSDLVVVGTGEHLTRESFAQYRSRGSKLVAVPEGTMDLARTVDLALREDFCLIGSDGGISREGTANSHPRGAGCFATALRRAEDTDFGLERMLQILCERPRRLLCPNVDDRGVIREGAWADLVIFDPATIRSRATVYTPGRRSDGIEAVFVNGKLAYRGGVFHESAGVGVMARPA